jgi:hypothetical protein
MRISHLLSRPIFSDGRHNAFSDIARFGDHYYVTFRNSESHRAPQSRIFVIRSRADDLERWDKVADLGLDGDARDSKLLAVGDALHVYFHVQNDDWVSVTRDGVKWSDPKRITTDLPAQPPDGGDGRGLWRWWLWRPRTGPDAFYSVARLGWFKDGFNRLVLLRSTDGLDWKSVHPPEDGIMKAVPAYTGANETDLAFLADGTAIAAVRTHQEGFIAAAPPPYTEWRSVATGVFNFGGPALWRTRHGLLLCARQYDRGQPPKTMLWWLRDGQLLTPHVVPSGGDCSYAGFADGPNSEVLMSYYSSHEWRTSVIGDGPANIYLARIEIEPGTVQC